MSTVNTPDTSTNSTPSKYGPGGFGAFALRTAATILAVIATLGAINILFDLNLTYRRTLEIPKGWGTVGILAGCSALFFYLAAMLTKRGTARGRV